MPPESRAERPVPEWLRCRNCGSLMATVATASERATEFAARCPSCGHVWLHRDGPSPEGPDEHGPGGGGSGR